MATLSCVSELQDEGREAVTPEPGAPVQLTFDVAFPTTSPATRLDADPSDDIDNLYLIVFDGNGYFTEYAEAQIGAAGSHEGHYYEKQISVTLSQTDKPRIIHFVANCPEDQIVYGHESDVIGGMTVSGGVPSYWQRVEVSAILDDDQNGSVDALTACVPLVRNFAEIRVAVAENEYTEKFTAESYYLYNDIDKGTVAPFNVGRNAFQTYLDAQGVQLGYDVLLDDYGYEGHAVSGVTLSPAPSDDKGFVSVNTSWFMYERKISARTSNEQSWLESPNHIIIKGTYDGEPAYYKVDLVRMVNYTDESNVTTKISQYFNILRNFQYTFTVNNVHSAGYGTLAEALANPAGNNLSGSVDTQGLVNLSDGEGRIFVTYTDTTLVNSDVITLRYRYVENLQNPDDTANEEVHFHDIDGGSVIESYSNATTDDADGWRTLTIRPYAPGTRTLQQQITLHHTNANLTRVVTFTLKNPYEMSVVCNPDQLDGDVGEDFKIAVSVPDDLPESLFPLEFAIEADDMSIAPVAPAYSADGSHVSNQIPVFSGRSTIPGKTGTTFHYVKTLTYDAYMALTPAAGTRTLTLPFQTNKVVSATKVYVTNKYFAPAYDWIYTGNATVIENLTINFSWQANLGATQTVHVYNASGAEIAEPMEITTGSATVTMVLYGSLGNNDMIYFRFTNAAGDTYMANATLQQVKDGQTLNFNKES